MVATLTLLASASACPLPVDERVVLESHGWRLVGEWRAAETEDEPAPAVLLLHRAAGSRGE
ncbi:MAG TPA: hypothetical protein VLK65_17470 [Vicinamibacteria bacterium]|nr:hypothetical protein [Vicinamibacteria bacterium]